MVCHFSLASLTMNLNTDGVAKLSKASPHALCGQENELSLTHVLKPPDDDILMG